MTTSSKKRSLAIDNPELSKQWHPTRNIDLSPNDVTVGSNRKVWWICNQSHEWEASVVNRSNGRGCPFCSGKRAIHDNCLQTINPKLAKQWHSSLNGELTPSCVTAKSGKYVWWQCEKGHEWKASIASRSNGSGCPFCSGRRATHDNCLLTLYPDLSVQWHIRSWIAITAYSWYICYRLQPHANESEQRHILPAEVYDPL